MTQGIRSSSPSDAPKAGSADQGVRAILLLEEDREAARRLLALLADASGSTERESDDRREALARAKSALLLRQRRTEILGPRFSSEPPFSMLLALYATAGAESGLTATRLTQIAGLRVSTALRWLNPLVAEKWIVREDDAEDGRRTRLSLSDKARAALDLLFGGSA